MKKIFKKISLLGLICLISITSFANCFGKFSLVRKLYAFNESINIGSGKVSDVFKTLIFYLLAAVQIYTIAGLVDFLAMNLFEFWTGSNPVSIGEFDKNGNLVKNYNQDGEKISFTYSNFGEKLEIDFHKKEVENLVVLKSKPNQFFIEKDGVLSELKMDSKSIQNKTLLKMSLNGKTESTKVINSSDLQEVRF